jgi:hypothetical protein
LLRANNFFELRCTPQNLNKGQSSVQGLKIAAQMVFSVQDVVFPRFTISSLHAADREAVFFRINGSSVSSASYPTLFLSFCIASLVVVPEPKKGSSTVSPFTLNIRMRRSTISSGKDAIFLSRWLVVWRVPIMSHICVNHSSRCFFVKALS